MMTPTYVTERIHQHCIFSSIVNIQNRTKETERTIMKYLRTLTVFLLLAIHTCTPDEMASASHCPDSVCFCRVLDTADCSYRNLSNIPSGLPASIRTIEITRDVGSFQ
uniref:Uncharacterized protein n=1 Tax=Magallana gigas TaxID=29159 RepID=A0A8W8KH69_MAGGI